MFSHCNARLAQLVEHYLDTVGVIGSSPIPRTISSIPFSFQFFTRLAAVFAEEAGDFCVTCINGRIKRC